MLQAPFSHFFSLLLMRKTTFQWSKVVSEVNFPLIRGMFLLRSGLRFAFRALEVPEPNKNAIRLALLSSHIALSILPVTPLLYIGNSPFFSSKQALRLGSDHCGTEDSSQYRAIPCNTMQYHVIPCNTMQYNAIPCNTMQYHAIPYNTMQYHAIPCNTMQYHA